MQGKAVCPNTDPDTAKLIKQNNDLMKKCGALPLEVLKEALTMARSSMEKQIVVMYDVLQITLNLMILVVVKEPGLKQSATSSLFFWFQQLFIDSMQALMELGTLVFKMLFEISPIGGILKKALQIICQAVVWLTNNIWNTFLCPILKDLLPPLLETMTTFANKLHAGLEVIFPLFDWAYVDDIAKAFSSMHTYVTNSDWACNRTMPDNCFPDTNSTMPDGTLPSSSRYMPQQLPRQSVYVFCIMVCVPTIFCIMVRICIL